MPEGPEAQTLTDALNQTTTGFFLAEVSPIGGRYLKKNIPGLGEKFSKSENLVVGIRRHGKAIVFDLSSKDHVVVTLGMTGKFSRVREKHAAVEFVFQNENEKFSLFFVDQRRFGTVRIIPAEKLQDALPNLGWDALAEEVDVQKVRNSVSKKKQNSVIGSLMMDNSIFSGIGNYLRAEILYQSRVSPWKKFSELSSSELETLCTNARTICLRSYSLGDNTIENFSSIDTGPGKFYEELKVYGKKIDPDGHEVVTEQTPEGRTIHWCPAVQKS